MSSAFEKIIEKAKNIPVVLDGDKKKLCDLEKGIYDAVLKSLGGEGDIYLGEKTAQGIGIHLFHIGLFSEESLNFYGYEVRLKVPVKEAY